MVGIQCTLQLLQLRNQYHKISIIDSTKVTTMQPTLHLLFVLPSLHSWLLSVIIWLHHSLLWILCSNCLCHLTSSTYLSPLFPLCEAWTLQCCQSIVPKVLDILIETNQILNKIWLVNTKFPSGQKQLILSLVHSKTAFLNLYYISFQLVPTFNPILFLLWEFQIFFPAVKSP